MLRKWCCCLIGWLFCLLPGLAEETFPALYPVEANGKWGYCDDTGNMVIPPQWDVASEFHNEVAMVCTAYEYGKQNDTCGLIDPHGEYLLQPIYSIYDEQDIFSIIQRDDQGNTLCGYWDKATCFYLSPQYEHVLDHFPYYAQRPNGQLIAARSAETGKWGFLYRSTGEIALPFIYDDVLFTFSNGYAMVVIENEFMDDWLVIDEQGDALQFGDGISPAWGPTTNGIVIIEKTAETEDEMKNSLWGCVYGLANTKEEIVLAPCYGFIEWLNDEQYAFCTADERWGLMNEEGMVIIPARYETQEELIDQNNLSFPGGAE